MVIGWIINLSDRETEPFPSSNLPIFEKQCI